MSRNLLPDTGTELPATAWHLYYQSFNDCYYTDDLQRSKAAHAFCQFRFSLRAPGHQAVSDKVS